MYPQCRNRVAAGIDDDDGVALLLGGRMGNAAGDNGLRGFGVEPRRRLGHGG